MLKEILAITGKPGLFKIVSHNGKTLIVESMLDGKRFPVSARDRVMSLGDIAMYTEDEDKPLNEILETILKEENGKEINVKEVLNSKGLKGQFAVYVPNFDNERVHDSDIKKLFNWYNLLVANGFTSFIAEGEKEDNAEESEAGKDESKEDK